MPKTEAKQRPVMISPALHAALKTLAFRKGMKLGALVEFKLRELVEPELDLAETEGGK
jgi:hypothetical protein